MTDQPDHDHAEQDRKDRRIKWASVLATTFDAVSRIADIFLRR